MKIQRTLHKWASQFYNFIAGGQNEQQLHTLHQNEKHYRLLAENISDMVTLHLPDGRFIYASPSYLKATGYSEAELLAMPVEDLTSLVHPDDLQRTRDEGHQQVLEGLSVTQLEYRRRRKDGSYMWVQVHSRPIFDDKNNVIQIIASSRNITYRKQMEDTLHKTEERLQLVLKNASVIVASADCDLRYIWIYNPHPDFDPNTVIGKRDDEVIQNAGTQALMQLKQQVINTGLDAQADIIFPLSSGAITYTVKAQPLCSAEGEIIGVSTVAFDITERKQLEEKLYLLDRAIQFSSAGIAIVDAQDYQTMSIVYANPAFSAITGYEQAELIGQNIRILYPYNRQQPAFDEMRSAVREQRSCKVVVRAYRKDGTRFWNEIRFAPVFDNNGTLTHFVTTQLDVTDRVTYEAHLQGVLDSLINGIMAFNSVRADDGKIIDFEWTMVNKISEEMVGRSASDLIGKRLLEEMPGNREDGLFDHYVRVVENDTLFDHEHHYTHEGLDTWFRTVAVKLEDGFVVTFADITKRKIAEQQLKEKHDELDRFFTSALDLLCIATTDGYFLKVNAEWQALLGYSTEELEGRQFLDFVHPDDIESTLEAMQTLDQQTAVLSFVNRYRNKNGQYHLIEWRSYPYGNLIYAAARDITERVQMEQALTRRNQHLTLLHNIQLDLLNRRDADDLLQALTDNVLEIVDAQGSEIMLIVESDVLVSVAQSPLLGYRLPLRTELRRGEGGHLAWQAHDTRRPAVVEDYSLWDKRNRVYDSLKPSAVMNLPVLIGERCIGVLAIGRNRDNYPFDEDTINIGMMYANMIALILDRTNQYEAALNEIERRKHAEAHQQQLTADLQAANEELKSFAYIISHDLKAPLRGINSVVTWLKQDYASHFDDSGQQMLDLLQGRAQRMEAMINGVLAYSRLGQQSPKTAVDLNELLEAIMADVPLSKNCKIDIQASLPIIYADPIRMRQVFQNLIGNAFKYNNKSFCEVHIGCQHQDEEWLFYVKDNGPGIDPRYAERIFQIFQTLNPRDEVESTGIGLTIVKRIIKSYGGRIWVESTLGEGSTFIFTLPMESDLDEYI